MIRGFEVINDRFKKNVEEIKLPTRATEGSSGYDFYMPINASIPPNSRVLIWSDVKAYMLKDEELLIYPRSSLGVKGIILSNVVGKVDSDYYNNESTGGNIGLTLWNTTDEVFELKKGDRVCQGTFSKFLIVDNDKPLETVRRGGFGHSGL